MNITKIKKILNTYNDTKALKVLKLKEKELINIYLYNGYTDREVKLNGYTDREIKLIKEQIEHDKKRLKIEHDKKRLNNNEQLLKVLNEIFVKEFNKEVNRLIKK